MKVPSADKDGRIRIVRAFFIGNGQLPWFGYFLDKGNDNKL